MEDESYRRCQEKLNAMTPQERKRVFQKVFEEFEKVVLKGEATDEPAGILGNPDRSAKRKAPSSSGGRAGFGNFNDRFQKAVFKENKKR